MRDKSQQCLCSFVLSTGSKDKPKLKQHATMITFVTFVCSTEFIPLPELQYCEEFRAKNLFQELCLGYKK